ncbi:hypothetical protein ACHAXH_004462 [Discostella pseudostelligera]
MVLYGQIVIGAPGSGKTTYCNGMQQYLQLLGRECHVVNLDPANEVPPSSTLPTTSTADDDDGEKVDVDDDGNAAIDEPIGGSGDVGNSQLPYETILDVCQDIISLDSVMSELNLGPNGGLLYCMEYIEHHLGTVLQLLKERLGIIEGSSGCGGAYLLFDLPGQIELTAHSNVISRIAQRLVRELDLRLVCVQLVDAAVCCTDVSKFIGAALVCTASMMRLELPCVNILSKMDLLQMSSSMGHRVKEREERDTDSDSGYNDDCDDSPLPFNLEFFTQCHDLHRLVDYLDSNPMENMAINNNNSSSGGLGSDPSLDYMEDPDYQKAQARTRSSNFSRKYRKLHMELCEVIEDFSLLSFLPLAIQDAESVGRVVARVDKCNGYVFLQENQLGAERGGVAGSKNINMQNMFSSAIVADSEWGTGVLADVQEKYLGEIMFKEDISELRKR